MQSISSEKLGLSSLFGWTAHKAAGQSSIQKANQTQLKLCVFCLSLYDGDYIVTINPQRLTVPAWLITWWF